MTIVKTTQVRYLAPTPHRYFTTRPAAYRAEAKGRLQLRWCDDLCEPDYPCRFHDPDRWKADGAGYSTNGRIAALYAAFLARADGVTIARPRRYIPCPDNDLGF